MLTEPHLISVCRWVVVSWCFDRLREVAFGIEVGKKDIKEA